MKIWGYLIAIALLLAGLTAAYTTYKNPDPTEIHFTEYSTKILAKEDTPEWLHLTNCNLDLKDAVYFESFFSKTSDIDEIFVPIKTASGVDSMVHLVLLSIKDKKTINVFKKLISLEDVELLTYMIENDSIINRKRIEIKGTERNWMDRDEKETKNFKEALPKLHSKFVIIEEGVEPSKQKLILIPLAFLIFYFLRSKKSIKEN